MGDYLATPVKEKKSEEAENGKVIFKYAYIIR